MKKTKIICTLGPATDNEDVLKKMMMSGMNVARFNFSHGSFADHEKRFNEVVKLREELSVPVATMLDTKGPEIRLGNFENPQGVIIENGAEYMLTTREVAGNEKMCSISYKGLPAEVKPGSEILINDGLIKFTVKSVNASDIVCEVVDGGKLTDHKGVNVPNVNLAMPYLSAKDMSDLEFGAKMKFDFIAASFVRTAADIDYLRNFCNALGWTGVRIIAKIENMQGVDNIDDIINSADGIMVARGDMGVEIPFEQIPAIQKSIIKKVYEAGKVVVTATQMLESMITNPRPTRAEITDVANAIYDGTSAIMLSGETAMGMHPVEAVVTMAQIAVTTEKEIDYKTNFDKFTSRMSSDITNAISHATVTTAHDLRAKAIVTVTKSGTTARMISKYRPDSLIVGATTSSAVYRQLALSWGVYPVMCKEKNNTDELFDHAIDVSMQSGYLKKGDLAVITAGIPLGQSGTTNMLKVHKV